jgi:hypothetical protein
MNTAQAKLYDTPSIGTAILIIRNTRVILDADLARFYGVATKALNQAVKRNADRFPVDFAFQLTDAEFDNLRSQIVTSSWGGRRHLPMVFTEHGVVMAASVLNSPSAVQMSVFVIRAFIRMRECLAERNALAKQLKAIDKKLLTHDAALLDLYEKLEPLLLPPPTPKKPIGFIREKQARYRA